MATNTQTNIVNINNMPEAQEIFDGNLLIVQNDSGTQVIDWRNLGVMKIDLNGNGTYNGGLTGGSITVSTATISTLSGASYYTNGKEGQTATADYYNTFEFTNGLMTSATNRIGSPEYEDIVNTRIPAITAALLSAFQANYTAYSIDFNFTVAGTYQASLGVLPDDLSSSDFSPADFTLAQSSGEVSLLSTFPVFYNISTGGFPAQLIVTVSVGQSNLTTTNYVVKAQKFYTALG